MSEEIYISKSIIKKVVTFLNEYNDNPHIICGYMKYPDFISVTIQIWTLNNFNLSKNIVCFSETINSETNIDLFKIKMKEKIDTSLEQLNND